MHTIVLDSQYHTKSINSYMLWPYWHIFTEYNHCIKQAFGIKQTALYNCVADDGQISS
jgi:hypothetical protein